MFAHTHIYNFFIPVTNLILIFSASIYHSAENVNLEDRKTTPFAIYPTLSEEKIDHSSPKEENHVTPNHVEKGLHSVDTLVLRSAGKYRNQHETIKLDSYMTAKIDGLDTVSLLSIVSVCYFLTLLLISTFHS